MRKSNSIDANFSLRAFALKAGLPLSNSSFFSKVIAGKRNLTLDLQFRIAKALKVDHAQATEGRHDRERAQDRQRQRDTNYKYAAEVH